MPIWFIIYLALMVLLLAANVVYALALGGRWLLACYELCGGAFFLGFGSAYWLPEWHFALPASLAPLFFFMLFTEFYLTLKLQPRDLGIELTEGFGERELDWSKALSALAMLPAYICGMLLCGELMAA